MNTNTQARLEIIDELRAANWTRSRAAELTKTPFAWRDPQGARGLYREVDALRIVRERNEAKNG